MEPITLVTGATGLVGNNVLRQLLDRGRRVRVLVRDRSDPRALAGLDVDKVVGDVCDRESVRCACRDVACVIHAAGYVQIGRRNGERHRAINVEGTRNVAEAARCGDARMIHVSSCDAVGLRSMKVPADEETPLAEPIRCWYVITKREAERVVLDEHARGLDVVIVNPGFMLGPWDWKPSSGRMLLEVARGRGWLAPRGCISVCDVRDVAAGILSAVERGSGGRRYILAGRTMTFLEAWRLFAAVSGGRRPLAAPGPIMLWVGGQLGDLFGRIRGKECDLNSAAIALARLPKHYNSARAQAELGYQSRPVEESVRDAWAWFREYGYC